MEEQLKRRLVGAVVLVSLAVIFLPMLVDDHSDAPVRIKQTNIPAMPKDESYPSHVIPLPDDEPSIPLPRDERPKSDTARADSSTANTQKTPRVGISAWVVQVASLSKRDNADKLKTKLRSKGHPAFVEQVSLKGRDLYRVRVGPKADRKDAERIAKEVERLVNLKGQIVRYP